jgi:Arc/MetJ family transcription regulator
LVISGRIGVRYTFIYTILQIDLQLEMHVGILRMRTNVVLDDELVREAFALTGAHTKRELLHLALQELVRKHKKRDLLELSGKVSLRDDFDHKELRSTRGGVD